MRTHISGQLVFHPARSALKVQGHRVLDGACGRHGPNHVLVPAAGGLRLVPGGQGGPWEILSIFIVVIIVVFMSCPAKPRRQRWSQHGGPEATQCGYGSHTFIRNTNNHLAYLSGELCCFLNPGGNAGPKKPSSPVSLTFMFSTLITTTKNKTF